ncbi:acyl-CoA thioesterase [Aquamicrobium sp. NLF2-7]|uniref:acyl-CoA thioesterase n=1 Tax=Aquamicrobium sp. NLF2-7 TaxID=2918753 RepID=UPI001EFB1924|nr:acyl-CoA thioesterase [Aquamicrobium sp. NLF2-7]MCG8272637.1 acyl-CoA thioesterase [Aquamicrobium sp. NLF2-7]
MPEELSLHSDARFSELVLPALTNHYGTLYGANALHLMGKAAFLCAARHAGCDVVMAKADGIEFHRPVRLGEIIDISARIVFRGRSSMTILVNAFTDDGGEKHPAISGHFMMVAVDGDGRPTPLPTSDQCNAEDIHS